MIPDDMIKKAKAAYINKRRKTCSHDSLIAALEAVAADIWDDGYGAGESSGFAIARDDWDDLPGDTNPYRIENA